ncbi:GntR family transcriptional regulator [Nonomuraea rhizosphaerae]|uniref:GntR family transcriptional regulator n=1 Tax=Nonomuraea rhizosphaerae TaxID=2665663 RepID=UPI001C605549|nr:GntR family transcriptional regulator [Nonomuraea rhizosphaerae]
MTGDMESLKPLTQRPDNLTTMVYDSIRRAIITRALPPGSRVSEARLAESLQVSKTPVREALLRLMHAGLIVSDGRRGGLIAKPSAAALQAAYELREALEGQTARLAARNAADDDLATIGRAAEQCLAGALAGDLETFRAQDKEFHLAVAAAAHSPYLRDAMADAYDLVWTLRLRDSPTADTATSCAHDHTAILAAITASDDTRAGELMSAHVRKVATSVLGAMAVNPAT